MLVSPHDFFGDHSVSLDDDAIAHVFVRDALVQLHENPAPLTWRHYQQAGLTAERVFGIGTWQGRSHVAVSLPADVTAQALGPAFKTAGLRSWFEVLDDQTLAIAMRAVQILEWDRTHRYCGACGGPTSVSDHERARQCKACRLTFYARISPAMMVLITRGRELLLGRGVNFPPGRYSALAGFLEAGETIEEAVHREVMEEVGVTVHNLQYFASQSWPFPNSLMIAFTAEYEAGELKFDAAELADAQWFDIDALPQTPPRLSVAGALLTDTIERIRKTNYRR